VTGARGMMVHTSLPELVQEAQRGKEEGFRTYVETCPQYLYFTDEDMVRRGIWLKCAPTVRDKARVAGMWEMAEKGWIDTMGSDHVPTSREDMSKGDANFWEVGAGMPNIEFMTQSLLNGVNQGWLSLQRVPKILSEGPAKLYNLYPKKGAIQLGSDADLVIADLKASYKVTQDNIVSKAKWSPFESLTLQGMVVTTLVRGEPVMLDGVSVGKPEHGSYQPRLN
jgi:dihydroorotase-like cyclic amidohydrolase